jgi:two-component system cell cycle response regulator
MTERPGCVLVADDDMVNRLLLARGLERDGHRVRAVADGVEALEALRDGLFDCVLLDVLMPGMDGYQVLECIRSQPKFRHIPVIMISALEDVESVVRCIEMGADDYLPKPFDPVLLRARINAGLARKRLHDLEQEYLEQVGRGGGGGGGVGGGGGGWAGRGGCRGGQVRKQGTGRRRRPRRHPRAAGPRLPADGGRGTVA